MILILAEKTDVKKAIMAAIMPNAVNVGNGFASSQSQQIVIGATEGHILGLKSPEAYDKKYASWNLEDLPIFFENWETAPKKYKDPKWAERRKTTLETIQYYLGVADEVVNAGDNDDEGQLLIDEVLDYFGYHGKTTRLTTTDLSKKALAKAFENREDNAKYVCNGLAAKARGIADATLGFNVTRFLTCKTGVKLPIGRVKAVSMWLVVTRDKLNESFTKINYYTANASVPINGMTINPAFILHGLFHVAGIRRTLVFFRNANHILAV